MQIQKINQQLNYPQQKQTSFNGLPVALSCVPRAFTNVLRFLDTNQAIGACAVDIGCMVAPRTITDFGRGPSAGFETLRREASGTTNHAFIGPVYGALAGALVSNAINSEYGINAKNVFADFDTIDVMSKIHYDNVAKNQGISEYAKSIADGLHTGSENNIRNLSDAARKEFADTLKTMIDIPEGTDRKTVKNLIKQGKAKLRNIILTDLGNETAVRLKSSEKVVVSSLDDMIDSITSLSKSFFTDKVRTSFKAAKDMAGVEFIKSMKKFSTNRTLLGLGMGAAIGCCIQPLNIYLTKKKTGSDGFVGVDGRQKDKSFGFKLLKGAAALAFTAGAILSIGNPKNLLKNIQYKSLIPTLNQFKLVYGLTIASRFIAARDRDELREAAIKDTIGFASWLILGNFVAKGTLKGLNNLYKKSKGIDLGIVGKTRDEILFKGIKEAGIETIKDGKALRFKELVKLLPKGDKLTRTKLRYFNWAQLAGYLFSAAVLGVGVPKLNIYMTKKNEKKRKDAMEQAIINDMQRPENVAFMQQQIDARHIL